MENSKLDKLQSRQRRSKRELHRCCAHSLQMINRSPDWSTFSFQQRWALDFVLARRDPTLGDWNYIGIIAKWGNIKQDHFLTWTVRLRSAQGRRYCDGGKKDLPPTDMLSVPLCFRFPPGSGKKGQEEHRRKNANRGTLMCRFLTLTTPSTFGPKNIQHLGMQNSQHPLEGQRRALQEHRGSLSPPFRSKPETLPGFCR